jgi:hypothetical protein
VYSLPQSRIRADIKQVRAIEAVAAASWGPAALRTEQLKDQDMWPILEEVETGERPEWKDTTDRSPTYKGCRPRSKSLVVRNSRLEGHRESPNGRPQIAQRVLLQNRLKHVLTELHGGPSGGHLDVNKILNKVRPSTTGSRQEAISRSGVGSARTLQPVADPGPGFGAKCISKMSRHRSKNSHRLSRALPTEQPRKPNLLFAMDYFTKGPEAYAFPNQQASNVVEALVTNFFCPFGILRELHSNQGRDFESRLIQEGLHCLGASK